MCNAENVIPMNEATVFLGELGELGNKCFVGFRNQSWKGVIPKPRVSPAGEGSLRHRHRPRPSIRSAA
jgi:hypothetical protein